MALGTETRVGMLVIAAVAGLAWLGWQSGTLGPSTHASREMRILETYFEDAEGLDIGSKVKVAGIQVGEVSDIYLNGEGEAVVTMAVREGVQLPANVKAQVATSGLIGERFVALTTDFKPEGELPETVIKIPSLGTASVQDLATNFAKVSDDLEAVTSALRHSLGGKDNAEKLARIVNSMESIGTRLEDILVNEMEEDKISTIVNNLADFSTTLNEDAPTLVADLRDAAASLKKILSSNEAEAGEMISNMSSAAANLATITDKLAQGEGFLGKLLTEDSGALADFEVAMQDIQQVASKINQGEGTIGRLINDPATVDKLEGALDSFSELSGRIEAFRTEVDFNGYILPAEGVGKGHFGITFRPRPSRYYVLGVTGDGFAVEAEDARTDTAFRGQDFGEDLKFTVQFGHMFEQALFNRDLGFRIGIKDSTFGVGADMPFWGNFVKLSADLYDFSCENCGNASNDNPHLDLTAKVALVDRTLYAVGGYDNVFNQEIGSPFVGLGFTFQDDDLKYMVGQAL